MFGIWNNWNLPKNDAIALLALVLVIFLTFMAPWSLLTSKMRKEAGERYRFATLRDLKSGSGKTAATWRMNAEYHAQSGALLVNLSHRHNAPTNGFRLIAHLSADHIRPPLLGTTLWNQSNGTYRSAPIRLTRGEWVLSVTGRRQSRFIFRLEQPLLVR
jgi:hypothetical protein